MEDKIKNAIDMIKSSSLYELSKKIERKKNQVLNFQDIQICSKTIDELLKDTWNAAVTECYNIVLADLEEVEKNQNQNQSSQSPGRII